jgi:metal-dependent HD superfamily phosphatase/phosphodiesterase
MSDAALKVLPVYPPRVTLEVVQNDPELLAYLQMGDDYLGAIGYTEHGLRHSNLTAHIAGNILTRLGYSEREAEVAAVAGFIHDTGFLRRSSRARRSRASGCPTARWRP